MFSDPAVTATFAFFVVFAGMAAAGTLLTYRRGRGQVAPRLRQLAASSAPPTGAPPPAGSGVIRPLLNRLTRAGTFGASRMAELRTQCLRAGIFHPNAPALFVAAQGLLMLVLAAGSAAVACYALPASIGPRPSHGVFGNLPFGLKGSLCALVGCAAGLLAPSLWLTARVRGRQRALRNALPDALDMLVLCLEGGVSVNAAMQRVTDELQIVHPLLALEMTIVQREIQLGLTAGEALRKFGDRCGLPGVRDLALVLLQSERYGASVTKALRTYVEGARLERREEAEEIAQKAAVKILFPTLFCIFPAIFVVVLGPAAFQMAKLFAR